MTEVYGVPSPKQVQFDIEEAEEDEWECQDSQRSDHEDIHPADMQTDPVSVPPIEREIDIPREITLHPDSSFVADVAEDVTSGDTSSRDVTSGDTSSVECGASTHDQSSDESVQSLRRSTRKRQPKLYKGFQMY